ncbi:MAG: (d)CMP kinase [Bdellovibrionales bacterium]
MKLQHKSSSVVIAIDGLSASGKGTLARRLAAHYGYAYLDTGALYRAVALSVLRQGGNPADEEVAACAAERLDASAVRGYVDDHALRSEETSSAASKLSVFPSVRAALLQFQLNFCVNPPEGKAGAVLDGRDIGTVIAPEAPVKLYITASAETRAERRTKELREKGGDANYNAVVAEMRMRDARDSSRAAAPVCAAPDAVVLDTTYLDADQVFAKALAICDERLSGLTCKVPK